MKKTKIIAAIGGVCVAALSVFLIAADHIDAPAVAGTTSDIADLYAFEGDDPDNTVFIATLQGPLEPGTVTQNATFDEDVMIEFNIDNTGDFKEDLVIQAVKRGDSMYFFGPAQPAQQGLSSTVATFAQRNSVKISAVGETEVATNNGMTFFAGPRRDAFFFDFNRFNKVIAGEVAPEGFLPQGQAEDFFDTLNVLAIAVEVPNSLLGTAPAHVAGSVGINGLPPSYNVWVSAKRKQ
ncbi:MAG: molecular chaperone DnaK [Flavobacteriaceae bacterium]|nr:molecular chaperone DnaK [Flavobacteriaceae bacterium]